MNKIEKAGYGLVREARMSMVHEVLKLSGVALACLLLMVILIII